MPNARLILIFCRALNKITPNLLSNITVSPSDNGVIRPIIAPGNQYIMCNYELVLGMLMTRLIWIDIPITQPPIETCVTLHVISNENLCGSSSCLSPLYSISWRLQDLLTTQRLCHRFMIRLGGIEKVLARLNTWTHYHHTPTMLHERIQYTPKL